MQKPIYVVMKWSPRFHGWIFVYTYSTLLAALRHVHTHPRTRLHILRGRP